MTPKVQPAYLTPELAATYVGKSVRTLRRWTEKFSIPTYGPGQNQYRYADLDAFFGSRMSHVQIMSPRPERSKAYGVKSASLFSWYTHQYTHTPAKWLFTVAFPPPPGTLYTAPRRAVPPASQTVSAPRTRHSRSAR